MSRYPFFAAAVLGLYVLFEWRGINLLPAREHALMPTTIRSSPGGYRSYHTINGTGFQGGK